MNVSTSSMVQSQFCEIQENIASPEAPKATISNRSISNHGLHGRHHGRPSPRVNLMRQLAALRCMRVLLVVKPRIETPTASTLPSLSGIREDKPFRTSPFSKTLPENVVDRARLPNHPVTSPAEAAFGRTSREKRIQQMSLPFVDLVGMNAELGCYLGDRLFPLDGFQNDFALKLASQVFLIPCVIPYLLLRYGRPKMHLKPPSRFLGSFSTLRASQ